MTFLTFPHRTSGPVLEISEAENDPLDQNIKVSKLSEKKEILQNVTTGLVYDLKLPTKEDADSKSLVAKILHFMWIGSQEVPGKYQENVIVWRNNNPTYEVGENYGRKLIKKLLIHLSEVFFWTDNIRNLSLFERKKIQIKDIYRWLQWL